MTMSNPQVPQEGMPQDLFDRMSGALDGLPDVARTRPSTIQSTQPLLGVTTNWTVHTVRVPEIGDTIFVQFQDARGGVRFVIPPAVSNVIARQRDALTSKTRTRTAKRLAQERKAAGIVPGFLRTKKKK